MDRVGPRGERRLVQSILRAGLGLGSLSMAIGVVLALAEGRLQAHAVRLGDVPRLVAGGRPSAFMAVGILLLLATPITRVLALIVVFARHRDPRFAVIAGAVAALLAVGVFLGRV
ncbi:MAG: DUF1634 domain-containing protein [Actinomycetota bacterium]